MIKKIISKITFKKLFQNPVWEYGVAGNHVESRDCRTYRRNKLTGEVQFILWEAGEQGHKKDCWHLMNPTWWPTFIEGRHLVAFNAKALFTGMMMHISV